MDVHIPKAITDGLRLHGVDVLTAQEDGAARLPDSALLDRSTALGRVLFSQDKDLLREAVRRHNARETFAGSFSPINLKLRSASASGTWNSSLMQASRLIWSTRSNTCLFANASKLGEVQLDRAC